MLIKQSYTIDLFDTVTVRTKLSGTVNSGNTAAQTILVYDRINGLLLGTTNPDKNTGYWEISLAMRSDKQLMCICRDEGADFNADIYDRISLCSEDYPHLVEQDSLILPGDVLLQEYEASSPNYTLVGFPYNAYEYDLKTNITTLQATVPFVEGLFTDALGSVVTFGPGGDIPEITPGAIVNDTSGITGYGSVLLEDHTKRPIATPDLFGDGSDYYTVDFYNEVAVDVSAGAVPDVGVWSFEDRKLRSCCLRKKNYNTIFDTGVSLDNTNDWTISFWCFFDLAQHTSYDSFIFTQLYGIYFKMRPASRWFRMATGTGTAWNTLHTLSYPAGYGTRTDYWFHIVLCCTSTEMKVYMDGVLIGTFADNGITSTLNNPLIWGGQSNIYDECLQKVGNLRIFNREVTPVEVQQLFKEIPTGDATVDSINGHILQDNLFTVAGVSDTPTFSYPLNGDWADAINPSNNAVLGGITTYGDRLSFDGTNAMHTSPLCIGGTGTDNVGGESNLDIICKFRPHIKGGAIQTLYKSGGTANGIALALDSSDNIGLFGRASGVSTSILIPPTLFDVYQWYTVQGTPTTLSLYDASMNLITNASGTITAGDGTEQQSVGGSCEGSPVDGATAIQAFEGEIADVRVFQGGTSSLEFPNDLRIACEIGETGVECFVEVEKWDITNNEIELHVRVPQVSSSVDTILRFYFSPTHVPNMTHVGKIGDVAAQQVWDANYVGVYHMVNESGVIKDSTVNAYHLNLSGGVTIPGVIGDALDFDGLSYSQEGTGTAAEITAGGLSYEATIKRATQSPGIGTLFTKGQGSGNLGAFLGIPANSDALQFGTVTDYVSGGNITTGNWVNVAGTWDGSTGLSLYASGLPLTTVPTGAFSGYGATGEPLTIGAESVDGVIGNYLNGGLDELRVSNIERSAVWLELTNKSSNDTLLIFTDGGLHINPLITWEDHTALIATIPASEVASDQVDFPVRVSLGTLSGSSSVSTRYITDLYRRYGNWTGTAVAKYEFGHDRGGLGGFLLDNLEFDSNDLQEDDGAIVFNGAENSYITLPDSLRPILAASQVTIAFWINPKRHTTYYGIMGNLYYQELEIYWAYATSELVISTGHSTTTITGYNKISAVIADSEWVHVCYVRNLDASISELYFDGVLVATEPAVATVAITSNELRLGDCGRHTPCRASLSSLLVFGTALGAGSVASLYANRNYQTYKDNYVVSLFSAVDVLFPLLKGGAVESVRVTGDNSGGFISVAFTTDHLTYHVWNGSAWRAIASKDDTVHGVVGDTSWYYIDDTTNWVSGIDTPQYSLSKTFAFFQNTMPLTVVNSLTTVEFGALFDSSIGVFDAAVGMMTLNDRSLPKITKITYNDIEYWMSVVYDLAEYDGNITTSNLIWNYRQRELGTPAFKVFVMITGDMAWTECTVSDTPIPGITAGMTTIGKKMQFKVEFDSTFITEPEDINLEITIK